MSIYNINGDEISTDINLDSGFIEALASDGDKVEIEWELGSISTSTGSNSSSEIRVRTKTYLGYDFLRYIFVHCPDGWKFSYRKYKAVKSPTFISSSDFLTGNQILTDVSGKLYRFVLAVKNDTAITPNDIPNDFYCVPVYLPVWSDSANGHSIEAYTTARNSPELVSEMLTVAYTYYNNRNETHSGTRNMVYDNSNTIFDHIDDIEYTNGIDCSTFVGLCLRGIPYNQTAYYTLVAKSGREYRANEEYSWSKNPFEYETFYNRTSGLKGPSRNTGQLAQWLISQRREVYKDEKLANVDVGDVVFWSRNTGNNPMNMYRFLHINHVALIVKKKRVLPYDSEKTYSVGDAVQYNDALYTCKTAISTAESWTSSHWTQQYSSWDYIKLPYYHLVMESTTGNPTIQTHILERSWDNPSNVTENNFNTLSLICRPDLGSL